MPSQSFFSLFAAGLAAFAGIASAYTQPTGESPEGNPISAPGLNTIVPVGKPFSITWQPTTPGTVTLVLLKGASKNLKVVGPIVEKIDNSGSYSWTPPASLEPGTTGYGIQLIVDSNGQYQYTTQFGISNSGFSANSTATSSGSVPTSSSAQLSYMVAPGITSGAPASTASTAYSTKSFTTSYAVSSAASSGYSAGSPKAVNSTAYAVVTPTYSAASSSSPAAATTSVHTGGASGLTASFAGLVVAAGVAVFAF